MQHRSNWLIFADLLTLLILLLSLLLILLPQMAPILGDGNDDFIVPP